MANCNRSPAPRPSGVDTHDSAKTTHPKNDSGSDRDVSQDTPVIDFDPDQAIALDAGPDAAIANEWRFVVAGDSRGTAALGGHNREVLEEIVAASIALEAELFLFAGDLVWGSSDAKTLQAELAAWRDTVQPLIKAGIAVYPVRGNHDTGDLEAWNAVFKGDMALPVNGPKEEQNLTFFKVHNNALIIGLDVYVTRHQVNQSWLDEQLAQSAAEHVFTFTHEPAFSAHHLDCLDNYPAKRDAFWQSLEQANARVYLAGHDHFYAHARIDDGDGQPENDIHQYIVGTAGAPLVAVDDDYTGLNGNKTPIPVYSSSAYGFLLVEIEGQTATLTFMQRETKNSFGAKDTWSYKNRN